MIHNLIAVSRVASVVIMWRNSNAAVRRHTSQSLGWGAAGSDGSAANGSVRAYRRISTLVSPLPLNGV